MPFAASITMRSGFSAETSTNVSTRSTNAGQMSSSRIVPRVASRHSAATATVAHVEQPRLAADRQRALPHDLHAGVLLRVVRRGDGDPAVEAELADREIEHLRADHAEVEHLRAAVGRAFAHRRRHRRRREAHVAADREPLRPNCST